MLIFKCPITRIAMVRATPLVSCLSLTYPCLCHPSLPSDLLGFFGLCNRVGWWPCWCVVVAGQVSLGYRPGGFFGFTHRCSLYYVVWYLLLGLILTFSILLLVRTIADWDGCLCALIKPDNRHNARGQLSYNYNFLAMNHEFSQHSCLIACRSHLSLPTFSSGLTLELVPY